MTSSQRAEKVSSDAATRRVPSGERRTEEIVKRGLDVSVALILLVAFAPALLLISVAIYVFSGASPIYRQLRLGRGSTPFVIYKLRTMRPGAHEPHRRVRAIRKGEILSKRRVAPRVTALGVFLRRYSIDELPQLINVLRGDMSLVGPRPFSVEIFEAQKPFSREVARWMKVRHSLRPGMSGLWQVSGRSDLPSGELMRMDIDYVEGWTLARDLTILARTPAAVLSRRGAY